jgi:hypothetical protein
MRSILFASMIFALAACGDDGGKSRADAGPGDGGSGSDAGGNPPAQGLGAVCDDTHMCPTTPAGLECIALSDNATHGFCAAPCGMSANNQTPPTGGTAMCTASQPPPGNGTPLCAITGMAVGQPPMTPWFCGVACGTFMSMDLGTCPGGLTCTDNLCQ